MNILFGILMCLNIDIVILADCSISVKGHEKYIETAINEFSNRFKDTPTVRISIITFSDGAKIHNHLGDSIKFKIVVDATTNMTEGIRESINELYGDYAIPSNKKLIIIISDGAVNYEAETLNIANKAKSMNIGIAGILIKSKEATPEFMKSISDVYVETSYEILADQLKKLSICL